jgi:DNA-binding PadR family transcriptional regulator
MGFWQHGPEWWGPAGQRGGRNPGRRLKRGVLKFVLLKLLVESERHGYDLMRIWQRRGWGAPGPGSIYPALSSLEEEGFVKSRAEGDRRVYEITPLGRQHLEENMSHGHFFPNLFEPEREPEQPAPEGPGAGVRDAATRLMQAVSQIGPSSKPETLERVEEMLNAARKEIYTILAQE